MLRPSFLLPKLWRTLKALKLAHLSEKVHGQERKLRDCHLRWIKSSCLGLRLLAFAYSNATIIMSRGWHGWESQSASPCMPKLYQQYYSLTHTSTRHGLWNSDLQGGRRWRLTSCSGMHQSGHAWKPLLIITIDFGRITEALRFTAPANKQNSHLGLCVTQRSLWAGQPSSLTTSPALWLVTHTG